MGASSRTSKGAKSASSRRFRFAARELRGDVDGLAAARVPPLQLLGQPFSQLAEPLRLVGEEEQVQRGRGVDGPVGRPAAAPVVAAARGDLEESLEVRREVARQVPVLAAPQERPGRQRAAAGRAVERLP